MFYKTFKFNSKLKTNQTSNQNSPTPFFRSRCEENVAMSFWPETNSVCETTYFWEMIAILGKDFISCLISSNNRNLQLSSCQKIYTLLGVIWNAWPWSSDYARLSFGVHWYLNFVLLVHRNAKRYAELQSRFSLLKQLQSISHFFWLFLGASPLFLTKDLYTSALTFLDFKNFVLRGSCSCLLSFTCLRLLLPSALTAYIRP